MPWSNFIAHRGASAIAPENTMQSLQLAINLGAQSVEFDVQPSNDGQLVVFHDETLQRSSDIAKKISNCSVDELLSTEASYNFGAQQPPIYIPSFDEYLAAIEKSSIQFNCEIKCFYPKHNHCANFIGPFVERLQALEARCLVTSACKECLAIARSKLPDMTMGIIVYKIKDDTYKVCDQLNLKTISADAKFINKATIKQAKKQNVAVMGYTVNNYEQAKKLLALGVSSIFSDVIYKG